MKIHQLTVPEALRQTRSRHEGLTTGEAAARQANIRHAKRHTGLPEAWRLLLRQFRSPLVLLLLGAMILSEVVGDHMDAVIVLVIVLLSTGLGFYQEYRAVIKAKAIVLRDGKPFDLPLEEVVPGDVVLLNAGNTIPGDGLLLASSDLFVDESALTGESYPAEKKTGAVAADARQSQRTNSVFQGTHVVSGTARLLVIQTGAETEFGKISGQLRHPEPETDFERSLRHFGEMLVRVTLVFLIAIFAVNVFLNRPVLESFLFALALAVGMTPELLPAIVTVTLARGAGRMAQEQVIVRRLSSIENLGSMDVFCSDKTGTLTENHVKLQGALDASGEPSATVRRYAILNATFESGFSNPIDDALRMESVPEISDYRKLDEIPYDFIRKRLSVVVGKPDGKSHLMITKGAFANILAVCETVATPAGPRPLEGMKQDLQQRFEGYCRQGYRALGLATCDVTGDPQITREDERNMTFAGFLLFEDPPKAGAADAVEELRALGIRFKVITGDSRVVALRLGQQLGIRDPLIIAGEELHRMGEAVLARKAPTVDIFAETEPNQKEQILRALRRAGHVVGYLGDGINDAPALHAADVGISVDGAVDVAREAADIVLLHHDLKVLARGVRNGRITFANTLKYIYITTSANFGNMFSMAGASLFLGFLPLLPKQILLNNFLSDLPALGIATDTVDSEQTVHPCRWDQRFIRRFMVSFGLVSSLFDYVTFGVLLLVLHASEPQFQTTWFIESLMTEILIVMVIRSRRPMLRSRPGRLLLVATLLVAFATIILPYTKLAKIFGLVPLPWSFWVALVAITLLYLLASELLKRAMFAKLTRGTG